MNFRFYRRSENSGREARDGGRETGGEERGVRGEELEIRYYLKSNCWDTNKEERKNLSKNCYN